VRIKRGNNGGHGANKEGGWPQDEEQEIREIGRERGARRETRWPNRGTQAHVVYKRVAVYSLWIGHATVLWFERRGAERTRKVEELATKMTAGACCLVSKGDQFMYMICVIPVIV
jgi:hypothetical protein